LNGVAVIGAGPVGVICGLALAQNGIPVVIFEKEPKPLVDQRAASIHPPTLEMLHKLGVYEEILSKGLVSAIYRFHDRLTDSVVAEFDLNDLKDEFQFPFVLQYEQYKLTDSVSAMCRDRSDIVFHFGHELIDAKQDSDSVTIQVKGPDGIEQRQFDYLIGCDGGRSTVRKLSGIEFEGFTYPERFIKIATHFDFGKASSNIVYRNYFSDPDEWCNLFKVRGQTEDGLWRAIMPVKADETDQQALEPDAIEERLQRLYPNQGRFEIEYVNIYDVHQRVAKTFRSGRILLAGDSAHVNNPIGGMGMNGGIHDAINLAEKLTRVLKGEDDRLLDAYDRQRRHVAIEYVQAQTINNKRLLEERDPSVRQRNLDELRQLADDPDRSRSYMRRASLLESLKSAAAIE